MSALDQSPAVWLRDLLRQQPAVRSADFGIPPHSHHIEVITSAGRRLTFLALSDDEYEAEFVDYE